MIARKLASTEVARINEKKLIALMDSQGKDIAMDIANLESQMQELVHKTGITLEGGEFGKKANERLMEEIGGLENRVVSYIDSQVQEIN
mmetsp:Transcript_5002/g.7483  ORF Transcript_5002/g.7483 Transcript_5002/m.7483 type:complete len:89 (-) Transcript_5002:1373-1639(-)